MARRPIVAIDGPAASGKSTTARAVARELGYCHVDSGALYRAVTLVALEGLGPAEAWSEAAVVTAARSRGVAARPRAERLDVTVGGAMREEALRSDAVTAEVSRVAAMPAVRDFVNGLLRAASGAGGVVMEGRDIGTVVLPDAEAKVFLTASTGERARRRHRELAARGVSVSLAQVLREIEERDARDQGREASPLRPAPDAVVVDCTAFDLNEQVAAVQRVVEALVAPPRKARSRRRSA